MSIACCCVDRDPVVEQRSIDLLMALMLGDEADRAVPVFVVVPVHELRHPAARVQKALQRFDRQLRPVLQRPEQGLGEEVVVAHGRPTSRVRHAEPLQRGQHRLALHG